MNAMRRRALLTGLFLISGVVPLMMSGTAQAETWCRRDFDRDNPVCVFSSARDCVRAAAIMGGSCERERVGRAAVSKPCKTSREANLTRKRRADAAACDAS